ANASGRRFTPEARSPWERRAPARWTDSPAAQLASWCSSLPETDQRASRGGATPRRPRAPWARRASRPRSDSMDGRAGNAADELVLVPPGTGERLGSALHPRLLGGQVGRSGQAQTQHVQVPGPLGRAQACAGDLVPVAGDQLVRLEVNIAQHVLDGVVGLHPAVHDPAIVQLVDV